MLTKQQIRLNRQKFRKNMKACLITPSIAENSFLVDVQQIQISDHLKNKKRRKTSEDVRIMDDINYLKEIYISNSFQSLFELQQKIGEGNHSLVYKCRQIDTEQIYAVKIIKSFQQECLRQIKDQYRIKKTLDHPSISKAHYIFINQKTRTAHLVCEYIPFPTLRKFMKQNPHLKDSQKALILETILHALAYMHRHGVCHRDIKPQNILYNPISHEIKIIDFEISKMIKYTHLRHQMWTNTGSLHYKAPQMFLHSYNQLIDVWAFGVIAYQLAFGKLPFHCKYVNDTIKMICEATPNYEGVDVTQIYVQLLQKCLTKNPLKRATAKQVLHSLFILKHSTLSSSTSSPKIRKSIYSQDQQQKQPKFQMKLKDCQAPYNQDSKINGQNSFSVDIGIRFLE